MPLESPQQPGPVKVLIVDDDAAARIGIAAVVSAQRDLEVVAQAADGGEVVPAVNAHHPDVVLLDIQLGAMDGIEALRELGRLPQRPRVLMLTAFDSNDYIVDAIDAGADGYVLKVRLMEELAPAIRAVMQGDAFLSPSSTRRLLDQVSSSQRGAGRAEAARMISALTPKELDVLRRMAQGATNAQISAELFMSEGTVKAHIASLCRKLGGNRVQAVVLAERAGLLR